MSTSRRVTAPPATDRASVVLATREGALRDHVARLCAAAGTGLSVHDDAGAALRGWGGAAVVLVGTDLAPDLAALCPGRRGGVHLLAWAPVPDAAYRDAVALGAREVLELPRCEPWLVDLLAEAGEVSSGGSPGAGTSAGRRIAPVVGVVGGSGGAGATTFAAALAQVAATRGPVLAVDLDPLGPGLDRVLGLDERPGAGWEELGRTSGRLAARALREAVPGRGDLGVLTWRSEDVSPPTPAAVGAVLDAARRGHDLVVVDLARRLGPDAGVVPDVISRVDHVLVLARPGLATAAATHRLLRVLTGDGRDRVRLVVRGSPLDAARLERATGVAPLLSTGDQRGLAEAVDLGLGPVRHRRGALGRAATEVLDLLAVRGPAGLAA